MRTAGPATVTPQGQEDSPREYLGVDRLIGHILGVKTINKKASEYVNVCHNVSRWCVSDDARR